MNIENMVDAKGSMQGRTVLVTGSTDGVGKITAEKLAGLGANVLIHGRNSEKIFKTVAEIKQVTGNESVKGYEADFSDLAEVRKLGEKILSEYEGLDVLINNAGIGPGRPDEQSKPILCRDGHELRFQVNYLATVLLSQCLLPIIKKVQGRIINIASEAQSPVKFGSIMEVVGFEAYAQSKLAVIMYSIYFAEQVKDYNVCVNALDPGSFLNTRMVRDAFGASRKNPESGAEAHLNLASSAGLEGVTGKYFTELRITRAHEDAYNVELQQQLWNVTKELLADV